MLTYRRIIQQRGCKNRSKIQLCWQRFNIKDTWRVEPR